METKLQELKTRLQEATDLSLVSALLSWDQSTYMPPGGAAARGRQLALLGRLAHQAFTAPEIGRLLDELEPWAQTLPYDSDEASLVRVTRREYERAIKVPPALVAELNEHLSASWSAWAKARPANDFASVRPYLEKTLELSRRLADCFPGYEHIADPLIDYSDYGMKVSILRPLFAQLREKLMPLVQAITAMPPADDSCLHQRFPEDRQLAFGLEVVRQLGYDLERGRQDKTHHPFMTKFSLGDVRITTRVREDNFSEAFFSTIHEAGHAMYEQGINPAYEASPLGNAASAGVHESQSRLWENIVGRSWGFWQHFYPKLQAAFPEQFGSVPLETFYRAINKVQRSLIRTDADEVTYNLHIILRFDLEIQMLEGTLAIRDLPEAWHARYRSDLGVRAPDDRDGCLQDMHWYAGVIGGAFQGYTLGNIMSAQLYAAALRAQPDIPAQIARGEFQTLHGWLKDNVYRLGSKYTAAELIQRATGSPLTIEPYLAYLRSKYGELYALNGVNG
ncbi:MAG: carboxypeptidase M32 [Anaerolineales bacterium]|nr:carboxypeptidase M32 [Anaerolineales bacterium]